MARSVWSVSVAGTAACTGAAAGDAACVAWAGTPADRGIANAAIKAITENFFTAVVPLSANYFPRCYFGPDNAPGDRAPGAEGWAACPWKFLFSVLPFLKSKSRAPRRKPGRNRIQLRSSR